ncbi:hypothetical protein UFOVP678_3 [uncultured Caudovirales phage]|uniref:C1q domain containing protein n=1 Tax=uncultured Caudovirales phage TaxID=2100421 RepID=A0A6J5NHY7_9CAUD|nr:hypothetical protein UFOVP678_3 [uncultured Caudovirales phage]
MASIITATTTSGLTQSADNSGVLQLASGSGNLVTVPSVTGTVMVSGNIPTFYAYLNSTQAVTGGVWTKVQLNAELFDTANAFNTSTNRFTPLVAGYYQINAQPGGIDTTYSGGNASAIYKNGAYYSSAYIANTGIPAISNLVYLNGSTDYVELYVYLGTSQNLTASAGSNYLSGFLARAA